MVSKSSCCVLLHVILKPRGVFTTLAKAVFGSLRTGPAPAKVACDISVVPPAHTRTFYMVYLVATLFNSSDNSEIGSCTNRCIMLLRILHKTESNVIDGFYPHMGLTITCIAGERVIFY